MSDTPRDPDNFRRPLYDRDRDQFVLPFIRDEPADEGYGGGCVAATIGGISGGLMVALLFTFWPW